eukprot:304055_1
MHLIKSRSSFIVLIVLTVLWQQIKITKCMGCHHSATNEIEVIADKVYGCPVKNENRASPAVCRDGYHVCSGEKQLAVLGVTKDQCANLSENDEFFFTNEGAPGPRCRAHPTDNLAANDDDIYRFWGCGSSSKLSNQDYTEVNKCGIFDVAIYIEDYIINSALCCIDAENDGCYGGNLHEIYMSQEVTPKALYICYQPECNEGYHMCNRNEAEILGLSPSYTVSNDQLLCCIDRNADSVCEDKWRQQEVIKDKVYACYGKYDNVEDAELKGCGAFYHVCNSANELQALGLSNEQCKNVGYMNQLYATLESQPIMSNSEQCDTSIDGVFGCSFEGMNNECPPLNSVLKHASLSDADGILCCTDGGWKDINWENMSYMASIRKSNGDHGCGGSIITLDGHNGNGAILTAAHCYEPMKDDTSKVYIGCSTTACDTDSDSKRVYNISSWNVHPDYMPMSEQIQYKHWFENDIAIIYLTEPITNANAISIILETDPMIAENDGIIKLTGYGGNATHAGPDVARGGSDTDTLEYTTTNIMTRKECTKIFGDVVITSNDFCVKDDIASNGMSTLCSGDSGSPLLYKGKQLGIVSFGLSCDPYYPDVATYIPSFIQWIKDECGSQCGSGQYLGCYANNHDLIHSVDGVHFNIEKCRNKCDGKRYFALQDDGNKCFCENDYELAVKYGESSECGSNKLGGKSSFSLFSHPAFKQIKYIPDHELIQNKIKLRYGPSIDPKNNIKYTVESCRISCSQFRYFSVSSNGQCLCDNVYNKQHNVKYDKHGLFENLLSDGIEINVNCDNFLMNISFINDEYSDYVALPLISGESYPYDDWT